MDEEKSTEEEGPLNKDDSISRGWKSTNEEENDEPVIEAFPKGDLVLIVEERELHVNRGVLTKASPVFRAMFDSNFKESKQERIELPGISYKAMVEFLKCIYPFINSHITATNVLLILPLADFYQTDLKTKCEEFMINTLRGKESFFIYRTDIDGCENKYPQQPGTHKDSGVTSLNKSTVSPCINLSRGQGTKSNCTPQIGVSTFSPFKVKHTETTSQFHSPHFGASQIVVSQSQNACARQAQVKAKDARTIEEFYTPGFGKEGFEIGNTIPPAKVVQYVLAAEKYTCEKFLIFAIQYIAMRSLSHYETVTGFCDISPETRLKITLLRLRIIENSRKNDFDLESSFWDI